MNEEDPTIIAPYYDASSDAPPDPAEDLNPVVELRATTSVKVESIGAPNPDGICTVTAKGLLPQPAKIGNMEVVFKVPATFRIELPTAEANALTLGGDYTVEL